MEILNFEKKINFVAEFWTVEILVDFRVIDFQYWNVYFQSVRKLNGWLKSLFLDW